MWVEDKILLEFLRPFRNNRPLWQRLRRLTKQVQHRCLTPEEVGCLSDASLASELHWKPSQIAALRIAVPYQADPWKEAVVRLYLACRRAGNEAAHRSWQKEKREKEQVRDLQQQAAAMAEERSRLEFEVEWTRANRRREEEPEEYE